LVGGFGHGGQEVLDRLGEVYFDGVVGGGLVLALAAFFLVFFLYDDLAVLVDEDLDLEGVLGEVTVFFVLLLGLAELFEGFAGDRDQGWFVVFGNFEVFEGGGEALGVDVGGAAGGFVAVGGVAGRAVRRTGVADQSFGPGAGLGRGHRQVVGGGLAGAGGRVELLGGDRGASLGRHQSDLGVLAAAVGGALQVLDHLRYLVEAVDESAGDPLQV
jgi:hypothetical protein